MLENIRSSYITIDIISIILSSLLLSLLLLIRILSRRARSFVWGAIWSCLAIFVWVLFDGLWVYGYRLLLVHVLSHKWLVVHYLDRAISKWIHNVFRWVILIIVVRVSILISNHSTGVNLLLIILHNKRGWNIVILVIAVYSHALIHSLVLSWCLRSLRYRSWSLLIVVRLLVLAYDLFLLVK